MGRVCLQISDSSDWRHGRPEWGKGWEGRIPWKSIRLITWESWSEWHGPSRGKTRGRTGVEMGDNNPTNSTAELMAEEDQDLSDTESIENENSDIAARLQPSDLQPDFLKAQTTWAEGGPLRLIKRETNAWKYPTSAFSTDSFGAIILIYSHDIGCHVRSAHKFLGFRELLLPRPSRIVSCTFNPAENGFYFYRTILRSSSLPQDRETTDSCYAGIWHLHCSWVS